MSDATIAVIMTAYNEKEEWLQQAIESVLNQTYRDIHLYVLLDHPDNDTLWQRIQQYAGTDGRVSAFINEENLGLVESLNRLLGLVQESYIARMDADDICLPRRLEQEMQFMQQQNLDFVMTGIDFIRKEQLEPGPEIPLLLPEQFAQCEKYGNYATHPTWLVKREVYQQLRGYRDVKYCEDLDFVLRAIQKGYRLGRMEEVLLHYRMRADGITNSYAYEQYEKAAFLRRIYARGQSVEEVSVQELNQRKDFTEEARKQEFQKAKGQIDAFAADLYKGNYAACIRNAVGGLLGSSLYRHIFWSTVKNNRKTNKIFRKARTT